MEDYLYWHREGAKYRLLACIDDLGVAKSLKVIGEFDLELETDKGRFTIDVRAFEPAWDSTGFVGVELPNPIEGKPRALYFDPRIAATLLDAKFLFSLGERKSYRKGKLLRLYSEDEAWKALQRIPFDGWAFEVICEELTWVSAEGKFVIGDDYGRGVPELEEKLWKLVRAPIATSGELLVEGVEGYLQRRHLNFLRSRFRHYKNMEIPAR